MQYTSLVKIDSRWLEFSGDRLIREISGDAEIDRMWNDRIETSVALFYRRIPAQS